MSLIEISKKLKKLLIDEKKPLFVDTNIYKYYVEYQKYKDGVLSNEFINTKKGINLKNSSILFEFVIKHNIKIKKNQMLEKEIDKVIVKSEKLEEKHYYNSLIEKLNIDSNITEYNSKEAILAKQLSPKSKYKIMDQDFLIIICCKKDNIVVIVTKDKSDYKACLDKYKNNTDKFDNIDSEIVLIILDQVPLLVENIEKIIIE